MQIFLQNQFADSLFFILAVVAHQIILQKWKPILQNYQMCNNKKKESCADVNWKGNNAVEGKGFCCWEHLKDGSEGGRDKVC